jgi:ABC-type iron transport system FetAB ATPase subunit
VQASISPDHAAVRHVLTAPRIASRTAPFIGRDTFDFVGLDREVETMSGGESLLVRIARDLWSAERTVGLAELVHKLDAGNFTRVLEALRIARGSFTWDLVEALVSERGEEDLAA